MKKSIFAAIIAATALLSSCHNGTPKANLKSEIDTVSYELGIAMSPGEQLVGYLTQAGSDSAYVDEFLKGFSEGMKVGDNKKKMAYYIGVMQGLQNKMQMPQLESQIFSGDSTKKVNMKNFISGYTALVKNKTALKIDGKLVDREEANKHIMSYIYKKQQSASAEFMAAKEKEAGVQKLDKGVLYKVIENSNSTERATANDSVVVKYEGLLSGGQVFDTSANQPNGVATLSLKNVIEGWKIALPQMPVGATWEIYIPYDLAYGEQGTGPIPPYSALTFKITLVKIVK
ncbi:MAG: FKBP-type peptidyl-prolyl cis-trans isomerase [Alloprevotella sp.]